MQTMRTYYVFGVLHPLAIQCSRVKLEITTAKPCERSVNKLVALNMYAPAKRLVGEIDMTDTWTEISKDNKATALVAMAASTRETALALQVRTPREFEQVSEFRRGVKAKLTEIESYRVHLKEPHLEGGRRVDAFFKPPLLALKSAEDRAKVVLLDYEAEQKRQAAEQQRKLDAEARKKREAYEAKARLEREKADQAAAEAKRREEKARKAGHIAEAVAIKHDADEADRKAEAKAEDTEHKASLVTAQKVEAYIPPVVRQYTKTLWKAKVINAKLVPDEYKVVDQKMLDAFAGATKGKAKLPGVEIYSVDVMVGGS